MRGETRGRDMKKPRKKPKMKEKKMKEGKKGRGREKKRRKKIVRLSKKKIICTPISRDRQCVMGPGWIELRPGYMSCCMHYQLSPGSAHHHSQILCLIKCNL